MRVARSIVLAAVLTPAATAAQGVAPDSAAFALVRAGDTIATEQRVRSVDRVEGELRIRRPASQRLTFRWELGPGGVVREAAWAVYVGGGAEPSRRGWARFTRDSVTLEDGSGPPVRRAARAGSVPFFTPSFVAVEQMLLRARALGGDSTTVPALGLVGGRPFDAVVRWRGRDSALVTLAGVPAIAVVDGAGALRRAEVPSQQLVIARVAWGAPTPDAGVPPEAPSEAHEGSAATPQEHPLAATRTTPRLAERRPREAVLGVVAAWLAARRRA